MQISLSEYIVMLDALIGSLAISDNGHIFNFGKETRQGLLTQLLERGKNIPLSRIKSDE